MKSGECALNCAVCGEPAVYCDSVPDASIESRGNEAGYRLKAFCWIHGVERKQVATSRVYQVLRCEGQGLSRLDRDRAGGDVLCADCGRKFYDHPQEKDYPFLNVLCDGSVVKL